MSKYNLKDTEYLLIIINVNFEFWRFLLILKFKPRNFIQKDENPKIKQT